MSMPPYTPQEPAARPAPGWYDDPSSPGRPRWWDGTQWAPPTSQPPQVPGVPPRHRALDAEGERRSGRAARIALLVGIVAYSLSTVLMVIVFDWFIVYFRDVFDAVERGATVAPDPPPMTDTQAVANLMTNVTSIGILVTIVLFLIWFYRSADNARRLGLPSRLSPVWTILGFLPVIGLWFPCWSALGLFPKGHSGRGVVIRWWLAWLAAGFLTNGSMMAIFYGSFNTAMVLAGVAAVFFLISGLLARQLIHEAGEMHLALAVQAGHTVPAATAPAPVDPWAKAAERRDDPWSTP